MGFDFSAFRAMEDELVRYWHRPENGWLPWEWVSSTPSSALENEPVRYRVRLESGTAAQAAGIRVLRSPQMAGSRSGLVQLP